MVNNNHFFARNMLPILILGVVHIEIFFIRLKAVTGTAFRQLKSAVKRWDVSVAIFSGLEFVKWVLERADLMRQGNVDPTGGAVDFMIENVVVVYVVEPYPDPVYYSYTYVIPSMQFTALYQVGGVALKLFDPNMYSPVRLTVYKGSLKAISSCAIILKNKYTKGKSITLGDAVMPFAKEPIVSVCKVGFDVASELINAPHNPLFIGAVYPFSVVRSFMGVVQKPVCNLLGELSHNGVKYLFGKQKLSAEQLESSVSFKTAWKTGHQVMEAELTSKLCVLGFYAGSIVPRSWGNDFIEELTTGNLEIEGVMLLPSNVTYYTSGIVMMCCLVSAPHFINGHGD